MVDKLCSDCSLSIETIRLNSINNAEVSIPTQCEYFAYTRGLLRQ
jgi:NMD protein affecting ribosome stability and mRNA decay